MDKAAAARVKLLQAQADAISAVLHRLKGDDNHAEYRQILTARWTNLQNEYMDIRARGSIEPTPRYTTMTDTKGAARGGRKDTTTDQAKPNAIEAELRKAGMLPRARNQTTKESGADGDWVKVKTSDAEADDDWVIVDDA